MLHAGIWKGLFKPIETRLGVLEGKYVRSQRFAVINSGTSGQITVPQNSQILFDDFGGDVDVIALKISDGKPVEESPVNSFGSVIAATIDASGNWNITDTPSSFPIALVYRVKTTLVNFDSDSSDIWGGFEVMGPRIIEDSFIYPISDNQVATALSDQVFDGTLYSSVYFIAEIFRGTNIAQHATISMVYLNGSWKVAVGIIIADNSDPNGLVFSISQTTTVGQLKIAADSRGDDGIVKLKRLLFSA